MLFWMYRYPVRMLIKNALYIRMPEFRLSINCTDLYYYTMIIYMFTCIVNYLNKTPLYFYSRILNYDVSVSH